MDWRVFVVSWFEIQATNLGCVAKDCRRSFRCAFSVPAVFSLIVMP